jgi:mRNA interferase MazF
VPKPKFNIREVIWATLPTRDPHGHEQEGSRPVVVVSVPSKIQAIPFDVIQVIPITKTALTGVLFPTLAAGSGGLPLESTALVYQLMVLDTTRVTGTLGTLTIEEYAPILEGIKAMLELGA